MIVRNDKRAIITSDLVVGHEYEVVVRAIGPDGTNQAMENAVRNTITIKGKQAAPTPPTGLAATGFINAISLTWVNPDDYDFDHIEVWRAGVDDSAMALKVANAYGITYLDAIGIAGVTRYYWIRAINTSGFASDYYPSTPTGISATTLQVMATDIDDFAVTATKMFTNTIILTGDAWTDNSPTAGKIAWNAHTIVYNGASYPISAGNTALAYVYWTIGATTYTGSATHPALGTTAFMIAVNTVGIHTLVWNSSANMVIGTAFIADLAVTEAKIANLSVTSAKIALLAVGSAQIAALSVDNGKIANLAITTGKIDDLAVRNAKIYDLNVSKLVAGTITSQAITLATAASVDCYINAGKTAWDNTQAGFILGIDATTPKFYIGDANTYLNWTGAALAIKGSVTITGGSGIASLTDAGDLSVLDVIGNAYITDLAVSKLTAGTIASQSIVLGITAGTGDVEIRAGIATGDFANVGAASGFIIGLDDSDSDKPKLYIGSATKYMKWDGTDLTIRGTLNANDITAGTFTGLTFRTDTGAAGHYKRVEIKSAADGTYPNSVIVYDSSNNPVIRLDDTLWYGAFAGLEVAHDYARIIARNSANTQGSFLAGNGEIYATQSILSETFIRANGYFKVGANQVVGARGAAVSDASAVTATATSGGWGFVNEAEMNAAIAVINGIRSQLNLLIARNRTHGLIAT